MQNRDLLIRSKWWVAGALVAVAAATSLISYTDAASKGPDSDAIASAKALSQAFADISEKASKSVVYVEIEQDVRPAGRHMSEQNPFGSDFFERFFQFPTPRNQAPQMPPGEGTPHRRVTGQGSGFAIGTDGYIITNNHVVDGAEKVNVTFTDGRKFEADVVGTDPQTDIAVIHVDGDNIPGLPLADSNGLRAGEWVLAIGSPFGLEHSVTSGIVSARGRGSVPLGGIEYQDFIQTDAAINPGNSGGPLLNLDGEVVGMNTAILSRSGGSMGVGFAIPSNMLTYVKDQIIGQGSVTRGYLGVVLGNLDTDVADWLDLQGKQGVLVTDVQDDTPAAKAGLQKNDLIVAYDGRDVKDMQTFRAWVSTTAPGTHVDLKVLRDGKTKKLDVAIGKLDAVAMQAANSGGAVEQLGMSLQPLTPELSEQFGLENQKGVAITEVQPGTTAAMAGLRPGMIIQEVNRIPVNNMADFNNAIGKTGGRNSVLLLVRDLRGYAWYVALRVR